MQVLQLFQNKMSCLWMGNLEPYMDEKFISRAFATLGELVVGVRIIHNKSHWGASGYCFIELPDETAAERCLRKANGKPLPGASPPRRFKLNRAAYGRQGENSDDYFGNPSHQHFLASADQYYQEWANYGYEGGQKGQNMGAYNSCNYEQYDYGNQPHKEDEDHSLEEPSVELDVEEANRMFMEESEELYEALIDCHWSVLEPPT